MSWVMSIVGKGKGTEIILLWLSAPCIQLKVKTVLGDDWSLFFSLEFRAHG